MAATLRLPQDLDHKLSTYCEQIGATKNRVTCLALRAYLDDGPVARVAPGPVVRETEGALAGDRLGAARLVRQTGRTGRDAFR